jgi:hypothetical protein
MRRLLTSVFFSSLLLFNVLILFDAFTHSNEEECACCCRREGPKESVFSLSSIFVNFLNNLTVEDCYDYCFNGPGCAKPDEPCQDGWVDCNEDICYAWEYNFGYYCEDIQIGCCLYDFYPWQWDWENPFCTYNGCPGEPPK